MFGKRSRVFSLSVLVVLAVVMAWVPVASASDPFLGQVMIVGFGFAPRGWLTCDGQVLQISQYQAFFSLLGTTYGGDGRTTFGLPDLRGRSAVHVGTGAGLSPIQWGQRGGAETHTLSLANMPSHTHVATARASSARGDSQDPCDAVWAVKPRDKDYSTELVPDVKMAADAITMSNAGGSQAFGIRSPFLGMYHVIAVTGIYPSRS